MKFVFLLLVCLVAASNSVAAEEYLDRPYKNHLHPKVSLRFQTHDQLGLETFPIRSDVLSMIQMQTPVRSQASRGTCSIFSATAIAESMLRIRFGADPDLDLSEQFLQYTATRYHQDDGSTSMRNFRLIFQFGLPHELTLPYIPVEWESLESSSLAKERCEHLEKSWKLKSCLIGNFDPDYLLLPDDLLSQTEPDLFIARKEASELKQQYFSYDALRPLTLVTTDKIKTALSEGLPLTLDLDFFYGAWNHRLAKEKGIPRNMDHYRQGLVGYPLEGSMDVQESLKDPAGHSIVIVGYDDEKEIQLEHLMADGTLVTRTYKGVYYFKNSWGTTALGSEFAIHGQSFPGYGMIVQDYAHQYGTFHQLPLK